MPGSLTQPQIPDGPPRASALRLVREDRPDGAGAGGRLWPAPAMTAPTAVERPRLLHVLAAERAPLIVVAAPAGFGKTTLLRQWAASDERGFAHVTLERGRDDDPARLARTLDAGLRRAKQAAGGRPIVLVLDDVHVLAGDAAFATLTGFADRLGARASLVLASRT